MPDEMDRVQDLILVELDEMQARRLSAVPVSAPAGTPVYCIGCDVEIDPRRVQAAAGCTRCVQCQVVAERSTR